MTRGSCAKWIKAKGGEQGDAMMLLLFALGQHNALSEVQNQLRPEEMLFAFLDDIHVVCRPGRVGVVHTMLENALWGHARIQVHAGKTKVWNRAGVRPEACDFLERRAHLAVERARVWRGGLETEARERGMKVLGTPVGHPEFVEHQLQAVRQHQHTLLDRANYFTRVVLLTIHTRSLWPMTTRCGDVSDACS